MSYYNTVFYLLQNAYPSSSAEVWRGRGVGRGDKYLVAVLWGSSREGLPLQEPKEKAESGCSRRDGVYLLRTLWTDALVIYSQHPDWSVPLPATSIIFWLLTLKGASSLSQSWNLQGLPAQWGSPGTDTGMWGVTGGVSGGRHGRRARVGGRSG